MTCRLGLSLLSTDIPSENCTLQPIHQDQKPIPGAEAHIDIGGFPEIIRYRPARGEVTTEPGYVCDGFIVACDVSVSADVRGTRMVKVKILERQSCYRVEEKGEDLEELTDICQTTLMAILEWSDLLHSP